jgi:hypothetical protein
MPFSEDWGGGGGRGGKEGGGGGGGRGEGGGGGLWEVLRENPGNKNIHKVESARSAPGFSPCSRVSFTANIYFLTRVPNSFLLLMGLCHGINTFGRLIIVNTLCPLFTALFCLFSHNVI